MADSSTSRKATVQNFRAGCFSLVILSWLRATKVAAVAYGGWL